jgi:ribose/xylose/arabinose/galactoside ABC-type transport system permease subunit
MSSMTPQVPSIEQPRWRARLPFSRQQIPLLTTAAVWILLYVAAGLYFDRFFTSRVFVNFFKNNAVLGIAAAGLTFVILSGGIDLSVGAMIAFTSVIIAVLVERRGVHPLPAMAVALAAGAAFGAVMGCLIAFYKLPPFLVTLAGMFLARGLALVVNRESIGINHRFYAALRDFNFNYFHIPATVFVAVIAVGMYVARYTRFGRNVYAIGGNENSAVLMGLPVRLTKVAVYALSGFCSALAGVVFTIAQSQGYAQTAVGLELDAIAAVVIGGTLLTGGIGSVFGTLLGVLILGIIQTAITFQNFNSWWTKIAIGGLLLAFILLQKALQVGGRGSGRHA